MHSGQYQYGYIGTYLWSLLDLYAIDIQFLIIKFLLRINFKFFNNVDNNLSNTYFIFLLILEINLIQVSTVHL